MFPGFFHTLTSFRSSYKKGRGEGCCPFCLNVKYGRFTFWSVVHVLFSVLLVLRSLVAISYSDSLACRERTLFSALVSPAKEIAGKTSAPRRLSSLMLLFQGHVACRNVYPNRVLIPTLSSLALKGQVGENTRKRLTISSFQPKKCHICPSSFRPVSHKW